MLLKRTLVPSIPHKLKHAYADILPDLYLPKKMAASATIKTAEGLSTISLSFSHTQGPGWFSLTCFSGDRLPPSAPPPHSIPYSSEAAFWGMFWTPAWGVGSGENLYSQKVFHYWSHAPKSENLLWVEILGRIQSYSGSHVAIQIKQEEFSSIQMISGKNMKSWYMWMCGGFTNFTL